MSSLNIEEGEILSFIRANGCVTKQDICNVSYVDEMTVDRALKALTDLGLISETDDGIKPVEQIAADE